jgi:hypothetical protein
VASTPTTSSPAVPLLRAALAYAERGWHVIPLRPGGKVPAVPDHPEHACTGRDRWCARAGRHVGWQDRATTDAGRITRAWSRPASTGWCGIGIACGPSGLLVLDLDVPKPNLPPAARRWLTERLGRLGLTPPATGADVLAVVLAPTGRTLPATYTVGTPSGGRHLYFTTGAGADGAALGNTARSLGPLIDTRAAGGQVVAPPTRVPVGAYRVLDPAPVSPLPGWLATALTPHPQAEPVGGRAPDLRAPAAGRWAGYLRAAVAAEVTRVTEAGEGERNHALLVAAIALGQLVASGSLAEDDVRAVLTDAATAHVATGAYSARQAQQTITSGLRRGARRPRRPPGTAA